MKFRSVNEFDTIQLKDTQLASLKILPSQMVIGVEGAVIKAGNSQNSRFEDMYCMALEMVLDGAILHDFCRQGYKYYDAEGNLLRQVEDVSLSSEEVNAVLNQVPGAYLFTLERTADGAILIFDIEDDDEDVQTYQLTFAFNSCTARWDRYSGPVGGEL